MTFREDFLRLWPARPNAPVLVLIRLASRTTLQSLRLMPRRISSVAASRKRHGASLRRVLVKCRLNAGGCEAHRTAWNYCVIFPVGLRGFRSMNPDSIAQSRIPVLAAAFGRGVQNGPQRIEIGRPARILAGVGGRRSH